MIGFGHYNQNIAEIVREIATCCILLGLDWTDETQVRTLIDECLDCAPERQLAMMRTPGERARGKLYALLGLLLDTMRQSAQAGVEVTGSGLWLALNRAFIEAYDRSKGNGRSSA